MTAVPTDTARSVLRESMAAAVADSVGLERIRAHLSHPAWHARWQFTLSAIACSAYSPFFDWDFSDWVSEVADLPGWQPEDVCERIVGQSTSLAGRGQESQAALFMAERSIDLLEVSTAARELIESDTVARRLVLDGLLRSAALVEGGDREDDDSLLALPTRPASVAPVHNALSAACEEDATLSSLLLSTPSVRLVRDGVLRRLASLESAFVRITELIENPRSCIALTIPHEVLHTSVVLAVVWRVPNCNHFDSLFVESAARSRLLALISDENERGLGDSALSAAGVIKRLENRDSGDRLCALAESLGSFWEQVQELLDIRRDERALALLLGQLSSRRTEARRKDLDARFRKDLSAMGTNASTECGGVLCPSPGAAHTGMPWQSILVLPLELRRFYAETVRDRAESTAVLSGSDLHMLVAARLQAGEDDDVVSYLEDGRRLLANVRTLIERTPTEGTPQDTTELQSDWVSFWADYYRPLFSRSDSPTSGMSRYQQALRDSVTRDKQQRDQRRSAIKLERYES